MSGPILGPHFGCLLIEVGFVGLAGFKRTAMSEVLETTSLRSSSRFVIKSTLRSERPVTFPPRPGKAIYEANSNRIAASTHNDRNRCCHLLSRSGWRHT